MPALSPSRELLVRLPVLGVLTAFAASLLSADADAGRWGGDEGTLVSAADPEEQLATSSTKSSKFKTPVSQNHQLLQSND